LGTNGALCYSGSGSQLSRYPLSSLVLFESIVSIYRWMNPSLAAVVILIISLRFGFDRKNLSVYSFSSNQIKSNKAIKNE
jgi:hypothetical protein